MPVLRQIGCSLLLDTVNRIVRNGTLAERNGFDHLRLGDHTIWPADLECPNAWTLLTAIGARTRRIMLSASVHDPYRRHPVEIAQSIATLDQLTSGRAALGIGAGEAMNLIPFGIRWESPLIRLREAVEVIRKLFEATPQSPAEFHGSIFSLSRAYLQIRPYQKPRPPIYLGALGPKTRRMTGELADGWYPWIEAPETFREHLKDVYTGARSAGRNPEEIDAVAVFFSAISDNYEDAFKAVEQSAREALVLERSVSKLLGHEIQITKELTIQSLEAKEQHMRVLREAMMEVPKELVGEVTVIGTADECIKKIEEYIASGATSVAMYNLGPDAEYTFEAYAKDIIPYLKERYRP